MSEQVISRSTGTYGRVQVTIPMKVKNSMLAWAAKSGMKKAEFFRVALMIGAAELADRVIAKDPNEGYLSEENIASQAVGGKGPEQLAKNAS